MYAQTKDDVNTNTKLPDAIKNAEKAEKNKNKEDKTKLAQMGPYDFQMMM
jgi:hypothetical protein